MSKRRLYIAAYDVTDPKRLRHALNVLKTFATGGQKSVFECYLTQTEKQELINAISAVLDISDDRFALLRLEPRAPVRTLGIAVQPVDPQFFYVG